MTIFTVGIGTIAPSFRSTLRACCACRNMHELWVTQRVLEIALKHGRQVRAGRVTDLYLVVGELCSVVDDSVQFYWDLISEGTAAEGAALHFRRLPLRLSCTACQRSYRPEADQYLCPGCGSAAVQVVGGDELFLESIEIQNGATP